jgi:hypothetical protein
METSWLWPAKRPKALEPKTQIRSILLRKRQPQAPTQPSDFEDFRKDRAQGCQQHWGERPSDSKKGPGSRPGLQQNWLTAC